MSTREDIYSSLWALLSGVPGFVMSSRTLQTWDALSPTAQMPALFMILGKESQVVVRGLPAISHLMPELFVYAATDKVSGVSAATVLSGLVDAVTAALAPDAATEEQTLGGRVSHCRIEGDIAMDEGVLGDIAMAIIPLKIVAVLTPFSTTVARIVVTPATFTLAVAATQALAFTLYDADDNVVTGRVTTYESADDTIATVDAAGLVTGVAGGECAIIVQCEGVTTASVATVTSEAAVALVIISPTDFSLDFGATQQLTIVTKDAQGNVLTGRAITYQSTASSKVAVNSSGLVAASASNAGVAAIIATSEGVSGAIAVTSVDPYAAFLAYDSVTRADNPSSPGSATEKGGAWTVLSGTGWGVSGGKLVCAGASAGLIQLGSKVDPTLQADVGGVWTAHDPGPAFRILDATNFLLLTSNGLSQVRLYSSLAGSFTNLGSFTATLTNGAASTLKVAVVGTSVNVYVAGSLVGNATLTGGAASLAGTGCGLYSDAGGTTSFFDNYQVLA